MYVVIVGAGRTGRHVIDSAVNDDQEVLVLEKDEVRAQWVSANMDCFVMNADASSLEKLKS
jgi:K+ transport systems, NAD-binding component